MFKINLLINFDFANKVNIISLGIKNIFILLLEYLTNVSVRIEIEKTSINLESE